MVETSSSHTLSGYVDRVTYHNEDNGYSVLKVKADKRRDIITLVCHVSSVSAGEHFEAQGEWQKHKEFGQQFKAASITTHHPSSLEGIEKYLASGLLRGVGPHFAKRLVTKFGAEIFDVLDSKPESLRKVPGIGAGRLEKIVKSWSEQRVVREILVFLQSNGVSTAKAARIFKTYGQKSVEVIKENPFRLARDIPGMGFKSADKIAARLGVAPDSMVRLRAGVQHVLSEKIRDGHCGYPHGLLVEESASLLETTTALVDTALEYEIIDGFALRELVKGTICVFSAGTAKSEQAIAERLLTLRNGQPPWEPIIVDRALVWVQSQLAIELAPQQTEAVKSALQEKLLILTGGPGTGKTTLTNAVLKILTARGIRSALCSPTGRAAKRLCESTGHEAKTIHRLLGHDRARGGFYYHAENPLPVDFLLVDEASMIDVFLMNSLLKAIPPEASLLLVGDVDQIPSVGAGAVLASLIHSGEIPTVRLSQIFRQASQSQIIANAHRINSGNLPVTDNANAESDFFFMSEDNPEKIARLIVDLVHRRLPKRYGFDPKKDIQVLCPMNRGIIGTQGLNTLLQSAINPNEEHFVERFGNRFGPGDKVMVTINDYDKEVFNGDVGYVTKLHPEEQAVSIDFDGREVEFDFKELDALLLAYACTIHKAQGSEYPAVVIPVHSQHALMLKKNLIYTGVTRGKKLVVLVGQTKAMAQAVHSADQGVRWSRLEERLRELAHARRESLPL